MEELLSFLKSFNLNDYLTIILIGCAAVTLYFYVKEVRERIRREKTTK